MNPVFWNVLFVTRITPTSWWATWLVCRLTLLSNFFLQKSLRRMKLTRFYLRQNLEPLGSVCICVGSLPTGLDSSKYETLISDILGESKSLSDLLLRLGENNCFIDFKLLQIWLELFYVRRKEVKFTFLYQLKVFWVYLGVRTCEVFLCIAAIVRVRVCYVDFLVFFVLRHWWISQVLTPRQSCFLQLNAFNNFLRPFTLKNDQDLFSTNNI